MKNELRPNGQSGNVTASLSPPPSQSVATEVMRGLLNSGQLVSCAEIEASIEDSLGSRHVGGALALEIWRQDWKPESSDGDAMGGRRTPWSCPLPPRQPPGSNSSHSRRGKMVWLIASCKHTLGSTNVMFRLSMVNHCGVAFPAGWRGMVIPVYWI